MKIYCLASSSAGNCYIMDFEIEGSHTLIMVECGIPYSKILAKCREFNIDASLINSCLITHAHGDHCQSAKDLYKRGVQIWASKSTLDKIGVGSRELKAEEPKSIEKGIAVLPFEVEHDIDGAFGFVIKTPTETAVFINDSKRWKTNLINFKPDVVMIECNYYHEMVYAQLNQLKKEVKSGLLDSDDLKEHNIKIKQHERNVNSHMSLHGTLVGLSKLNLRHCNSIILMHLSDRYANEYVMKTKVQEQTGVRTFVAGRNGGIH